VVAALSHLLDLPDDGLEVCPPEDLLLEILKQGNTRLIESQPAILKEQV
jgi:hypothetical protein